MIRRFRFFGLVFFMPILFSCTSAKQEDSLNINGYDLEVNGDTVQVNNFVWSKMGLKNYPFTTHGDIACSGNAIYFFPDDTLDKDIAGVPLNQTAKNIIVANGWEKEVPYNKLIASSNLKEAIDLGGKIKVLPNVQTK